MAIGLAIFSIMIILLSIYGALRPFRLILFVSSFMGGSGLWIAVIVRIILAILLWFSASSSLTPTTFQVLAVLALIAAFALPMIGGRRILKLIGWVETWRHPAIRLWSLLGVAFGGFLFWSVSPVWAVA